MTGPELKPLLIPPTERGTVAALAQFLTKNWGETVQAQDINGYFRRGKVNDRFLRGFAQFKGYDEEKFVAWARGPLQKAPYNNENDLQFVNEKSEKYTTVNYKEELNKVLNDNTTLLRIVESRNDLIQKLIEE